METIIDRVTSAAGRYEGHGDGAESGPFTATLVIASILDGMGASIDYTACAPDGSELHAEHTMLALDMWSGEPTLYVMCAELRGVGELVQVSDSTFSNGRGADGFELQIDILLGDDLEYVWSWGAPGEDLTEQSRATFALTSTTTP
jgi:hypothetical protein